MEAEYNAEFLGTTDIRFKDIAPIMPEPPTSKKPLASTPEIASFGSPAFETPETRLNSLESILSQVVQQQGRLLEQQGTLTTTVANLTQQLTESQQQQSQLIAQQADFQAQILELLRKGSPVTPIPPIEPNEGGEGGEGSPAPLDNSPTPAPWGPPRYQQWGI